MPVINPLAVPSPTGVCAPWDALCVDFPEDPTPEEQELIDSALLAATEVLWNRTKRVFGLCPATFRPCHDECGTRWPIYMLRPWQDATNWSWPFPALVGGQWINIACGSCDNGCSCGHPPSTLQLPFPLHDVIEVKIDGEVLDPSAYVVYNRRDLVRTDGGRWPRCNDLGSPDTEPGTWSVTANYGTPVPELGKQAVGQLASQLYKACTGGAGCLVPMNTIRQITRQGVQKVFFDANAAFTNGLTGLYFPDLFITTYNPTRTGVASIYRIDGPRRQQVTWTGGP